MSGAEENQPSPYPPTKIDPVVEKLHGVEVVDPYRWLEDGRQPRRQGMDRQGKRLHAVGPRQAARAATRSTPASSKLLDIGSLSTPLPAKGKYFYTKREGKQNQPILYVREGLHGKDRVLLDPNELDKEGTTALDWWFPTDDGRCWPTACRKTAASNRRCTSAKWPPARTLPDVIERTRLCSLAWLPDGKGFYYTRYPAVGGVPKGEENYHATSSSTRSAPIPAKDPKVFGDGRATEDCRTSPCRRTAAGWWSPRRRAGPSRRSTSPT